MSQSNGSQDPIQQYAILAADAIAAGNRPAAESAFGAIHRLFFDRLFLYVRGRLPQSSQRDGLAEEITSATFFDFWQQLGRFDKQLSARALLFKIAQNKSGRQTYKTAIEKRVFQDNKPTEEGRSLEETATGEAEVETQLVHAFDDDWRQRNRQQLMANFEINAPEFAQLAHMRYELQLTAQEIGNRLGLSHDLTRRRLLDARMALFTEGWRLIRKNSPPEYLSLPAYQPRTPKELASIMREDSRVHELFSDYFGLLS